MMASAIYDAIKFRLRDSLNYDMTTHNGNLCRRSSEEENFSCDSYAVVRLL